VNGDTVVLDTGLSALDHQLDADTLEADVGEAVKNALSSRRHMDFPVRFAMLLATADWSKKDTSLPRRVRDALERELGYRPPLLGGSMAKVFRWKDGGGFIDNGFVLLLCCSEYMWATVDSTAAPYDGEKPNQAELKALAERLGKADVRLGSSAERHLFGILPGVRTVRANAEEERIYQDNDLYYDILAAFNYRYSLNGAAAAESLRPSAGYQFANDEVLESGLALALIESDLASERKMETPFRPLKGVYFTADLGGSIEEGYDLDRVGETSAGTYLEELKGTVVSENPGATLLSREALILGVPYGDDYQILLPMQVPGRLPDRVRLNRKVREGTRISVMQQDEEVQVLLGRMIQQSLESMKAKKTDLGLILGFACAGLWGVYNKKGAKKEVVDDWCKRFLPGVTVVAGLCAGEFAADHLRGARANNLSLWTLCLLNRQSPRASTRKLQSDLMRTSAELQECRGPQAVMKRVLEGAVAAGALGGQICTQDPWLGRILGIEGYGYAFSKPGCGENWPAVAELTDRVAPAETGGAFPSNLMEYSIPVVSDARTWPTTQPLDPKEEDILTLVTRTRRAIFVADAKNVDLFHCDLKTVEIGGLHVFLCIPLVGPESRVVGTLQLSFEEGTWIDRESFALWVSFGQTVAAMLSQEQEAEERAIVEQLTRGAEQLADKPASVYQRPNWWCQQFAEMVKASLRAEIVHIRVARLVDESYEFRLEATAGTGALAELQRRTRLSTKPAHPGSVRSQLMTRSRAEAQQALSQIGTAQEAKTDEEKALGDQLKRELEKLEATAWLPLVVDDAKVGSLVVDSQQAYFFSAQRKRLVEKAAELALSVMLQQRNAYLKALSEAFERGLSAQVPEPGSSAEAAPGAFLGKVLGELGTAAGADWGSLFFYFEELDQLVLYSSWQWHERGWEGRAHYKTGEGWTGLLARLSDPLRILMPGCRDYGAVIRRYNEQIEPPSQREQGAQTPSHRVGVRISAGGKLIGALVLGYYEKNPLASEVGDGSRRVAMQRVGERLAALLASVRMQVGKGRQMSLHETEERVAQVLIRAMEDRPSWQEALDITREGFNVERATLYAVGAKTLTPLWSSRAANMPLPAGEFQIAAHESLQQVLTSQTETPLTIESESDARLKQWHFRQGVRSLHATRAVSRDNQIRGLLELVNRTTDPDHPYRFLNEMERRQADDIARLCGDALAISDARREADELRAKLDMATQIGGASLLGGLVVHELMGPFERIQENVDLLRTFPNRPPEPYFQAIEAQKDRAVEIIEGVVQRGAMVRRAESLHTIVREAVRVIRNTIPLAGMEVEVANEVRVQVEVVLMQMVGALVNVLNNAIDAMGHAGKMKIWTRYDEHLGRAFIAVHNSGPQLTPEVKERMFLPGFSRKQGHTGLGLALSRHTVLAAGGDMTAANEDDGVTVTIWLPVQRQRGGTTA
jgi:signal transduction histidine kinase